MLAALATALLLPGFTPVTPGPAGGQVLKGVLPRDRHGPATSISLRASTSAKRYPVVYLLHGIRGSPAEYIDATELPAFADTEIAAGRLRPFIAVLPAAGTTPKYDGEWAGLWEQRARRRHRPVDRRAPSDAADRSGTRDRRPLRRRVRRGRHRAAPPDALRDDRVVERLLQARCSTVRSGTRRARSSRRTIRGSSSKRSSRSSRGRASSSRPARRTAGGRRRRRASTTRASCAPSASATRSASIRAGRASGASSSTTG